MHANPDMGQIRDLLEGTRTVAVVGLSDKAYRTSHAIARALQRFGFKILPVNPNLTGPVLGEEPYATVEEIPEPVDIVDVFRRREDALDAVRRRKRGSRGIREGARSHRRHGPLHKGRLRRARRPVAGELSGEARREISPVMLFSQRRGNASVGGVREGGTGAPHVLLRHP